MNTSHNFFNIHFIFRIKEKSNDLERLEKEAELLPPSQEKDQIFISIRFFKVKYNKYQYI